MTRVAKTAWPALTQRPSPIVLATLAIVAVALFVLARAWRDTNAAIDAAHPPVLAVSTFKLLGPSQEFEFLAEGLRFDLQFELARFSWLAVSADHSDAAAQRPGKQPGSRKRNADYQLEGTINVSGQAVALSYQLISLKDSLVKWSKRSNVELSGNELVQLQRSAAEAIAIEIGHPSGVIKLLEQNRYRAQTKDVNGYLCLLRTYDYWNRFDKKSHGNVRNCLEQAIAKDSTDAQAHAALSFVYLDEFRYKQNIRPESDPLKRSLAAAERAAELDPFSALAKQALFTSHHFNGDGTAFRKYGLQAVELSPNNPEVLADFGGKLALYYGEWDRGMTFVQRAMELNPNPPAWFHITEACSAIMQNDPKRALEVSEQMRTSSWSLYHVIRAIAAAGLEDRKLAKIEWDRLATFGVNSIDDIRTTIANLRYHAALEKVLVERLTSSFKFVHGKP